MEPASTSLEHLLDRLVTGTERLLRTIATDASDETVASTATELWEVVDEVEDLLGTIDFERLPDAVEASVLPELLNLDELPDAIREKDPDVMLDLSTIRQVVTLRELWNTVDLVEFGKEARQLRTELEDVVDLGALETGGDSEAATEIETFVEEEKGNATNAAIQQEAKKAAKKARKGVIDGHSTFEDLYGSSQRGTGYAGRKPVSKNPTAVSSVPYGPLPASVSTRVSTVPANVRHARVDALPRIYGRRWRTGAPRR
ncbi:hypothetical protein ACFO5R_13805 [Halosolutus amylolyticus]|uniref:Uncharacterized protein n=1 Tax=Halosolutus amylolyticus TaxID=2932267 RepID=A0ABD5PRA4_9EURY|nr:hypothetical protein [Halosolutus amylolyticus]